MTEFLLFVLFCALVYQWVHGRQSRELLEDLRARVGRLEDGAQPPVRLVASESPARVSAPPAPRPIATPADLSVAPGAVRPITPVAPATPASVAASVSLAGAIVPAIDPLAPAEAAPPAPTLPSAPVALPRQQASPPPIPPPPPAPPRPSAEASAAPAPVASASVETDSLESRIGGRWALYFGVAFIVIAASVFVKYAVDHAWVTPAMRVILGGMTGLALVGAGTWFVRSGYAFYGQILTGGGVAVLYVCTYAAFNFFHLIGQGSAFALMAVITAAASMLADRQQSPGLALMAVGGGFATPFLVSTGGGSEVALFGYDAILVAGTMYLAHRREWPALNLVSCLLTLMTMAAWAVTSWTPADRWTTQFFLVLFGGMFLSIFRESRRQATVAGRAATLVLGGAVLAMHLASLANLWAHEPAVIVYLLALSLAGLLMIGTGRSPMLRLCLWVAVILPYFTVCDQSARSVGPFVLGVSLAALYGLHLAMQLRAILLGDDRPLAEAPEDPPAQRRTEPPSDQVPRGPAVSEIALIHAGGLLSFAAAHAFVADVRLDAAPVATLALAMVAAVAARILWQSRADAALHFTALCATLVAIAVAQHFDGPFVIAAWATEGAGLIWLGLRTDRMWVRLAGNALLMFGLVRLLELLSLPAPIGQWVFLNPRALTAIYVAALFVGLSRVHQRLDRSTFRDNLSTFYLLAANLVVLTAATSEINAYWNARSEGLDDRLSINLARTMSTIVAWMSVGTSILWIGLRRRASWMRVAGGFVVSGGYGLLVMMLLRLEPSMPAAPEGYTVVANARVIATLFVLGLLWHIARLHRRVAGELPGGAAIEIDALIVAGHIAALMAAVSEIEVFFALRNLGSLGAFSAYALSAAAIALAGGSLSYQGLRLERATLRIIGGLVLIPALLWIGALLVAPAPDGYRVVLNARTLSAVVQIAILYGLAALHRSATAQDRYAKTVIGATVLVASILTWLLLTSEIVAFWHLRNAGRTGYLARQMTVSIVWASYALALIAVGMWRDYAPIRYLAIGLLGITIVKVFFADLAELDQIYKILTAVGLGILLIVTSFLYQKRKRTAA